MAFFDFREHPGNLFVVATLLPLASFVLLLIAGAVRAFLRSNRDSALDSTIYRALGGDNPGNQRSRDGPHLDR